MPNLFANPSFMPHSLDTDNQMSSSLSLYCLGFNIFLEIFTSFSLKSCPHPSGSGAGLVGWKIHAKFGEFWMFLSGSSGAHTMQANSLLDCAILPKSCPPCLGHIFLIRTRINMKVCRNLPRYMMMIATNFNHFLKILKRVKWSHQSLVDSLQDCTNWLELVHLVWPTTSSFELQIL